MLHITIEQTEKPVVDITGCQNDWINVFVFHMQVLQKFRLHDKLLSQEGKTKSQDRDGCSEAAYQ